MAENLGLQMSKGAASLVTAAAFSKGLGFIGHYVLAWLLMPEAFGRVAIALAVGELLGVGPKLGLGRILINRQKEGDTWLGPMLGLGAVAGVVTFLLLLGSAAVVPLVFHSAPELGYLIVIVGVAQGFASVGVVLEAGLANRMKFTAIAKTQAVTIGTKVIVAISLASMGFGAAAILLSVAVESGLRVVLMARSLRPQIPWRAYWKNWINVVPDTRRTWLNNMLLVGQSQGDYLILAFFVSEAVLGAYFFAFTLSTQAVLLLMQSTASTLAAGLSKLQDDEDRLQAAYRRTITIVGLATAPLLLLQASMSSIGLRFLYGDKWLAAAVPLLLLSLSSVFAIFSWNAHAMFTATGRFQLQSRTTAFTALSFLFIVGVAAATTRSIVAVAIGVLVFRLIYVPLLLCIAGGSWHLLPRILGVLGRIIAAGAVATMFGWIIAGLVPGDASRPLLALCLGLGIVTTGLILPAAARGLSRPEWNELTSMARGGLPERLVRYIPTYFIR